MNADDINLDKIPTVTDFIPFLKKINGKIEGMPDYTLTVLLLAVALAIAVIAIKSPPLLKGMVLAWVILP